MLVPSPVSTLIVNMFCTFFFFQKANGINYWSTTFSLSLMWWNTFYCTVWAFFRTRHCIKSSTIVNISLFETSEIYIFFTPVFRLSYFKRQLCWDWELHFFLLINLLLIAVYFIEHAAVNSCLTWHTLSRKGLCWHWMPQKVTSKYQCVC